VIIAGLLSDNTAFILQGGLITGLMAILLYDAMAALEKRILRVPMAKGSRKPPASSRLDASVRAQRPAWPTIKADA